MRHSEETHVISVEERSHGDTLIATDHQQMDEVIDFIFHFLAEVLANVNLAPRPYLGRRRTATSSGWTRCPSWASGSRLLADRLGFGLHVGCIFDKYFRFRFV